MQDEAKGSALHRARAKLELLREGARSCGNQFKTNHPNGNNQAAHAGLVIRLASSGTPRS